MMHHRVVGKPIPPDSSRPPRPPRPSVRAACRALGPGPASALRGTPHPTPSPGRPGRPAAAGEGCSQAPAPAWPAGPASAAPRPPAPIGRGELVPAPCAPGRRRHPALLHGPRAGSCFPGGCGRGTVLSSSCKGAPAPRGCSVESPGSAPRPRARRRGYSPGPGRVQSRGWRSAGRLCRGEAAGSTAHCEATSMRPSSSRPFPPPPPA